MINAVVVQTAQWSIYSKLLQSRVWCSALSSLLLCSILFALSHCPTSSWSQTLPVLRHQNVPKPILLRNLAANNTLRFQKILTLSIGPSWCSRGLKAAASLADLDVEIPDHPPLADELVDAFSNIGDKHKVLALPPTGAARAWLSRLNLLEHVVQSGLQTALILEDEVDWDLEVKNQMRLF